MMRNKCQIWGGAVGGPWEGFGKCLRRGKRRGASSRENRLLAKCLQRYANYFTPSSLQPPGWGRVGVVTVLFYRGRDCSRRKVWSKGAKAHSQEVPARIDLL